ncbi:hypothetical protein GGR53DRAFT_461390 [Hypoxylon sp. FL1150]|nr:hypothetical protein GGR53DRAFT_461390 [Hypoxylon sp. FL1150]
MPTRSPEKDAKALHRAVAEAEAGEQGAAGLASDQDAGVEVPEFPRGNISLGDKTLIELQDLDASNRVAVEEPRIIAITEDIGRIQSKAAEQIADGAVFSNERNGRLIETFQVRGRTVARITLRDADVDKEGCRRPYGDLEVCKFNERHITTMMGRGQPELDVEQWAAAHLLLASGGDIDAHPGRFWARARDVAQQELWRVPALATLMRAQIDATPDDVLARSDPNLLAMLGKVRACLSQPAPNPWHQAARDEFAAANFVYDHITADIFMALDNYGKVIAFAMKDAICEVRDLKDQWRMTIAMQSYTLLHPLPTPDKIQNGLHHADWISRIRRDLDPQNHPQGAKCGTWTIGMESGARNPSADHLPCEVLDFAYRGSPSKLRQLRHVRHSVLGPCTAVADYFLALLDPDLRKQLVRASEAVNRHHPRSPYLVFKTLPDDEPYTLRTIGVNTKRYEGDLRDEGAWERGLGALVPLGDFEGGDLLLRELGVRVQCPPGSLQLLRNGELRYSTTPFSGWRYEVSQQTPEGVRRWAEDRMADQLSWGDAEVDPLLMDMYFANTDDDQPAHQQQQQQQQEDAAAQDTTFRQERSQTTITDFLQRDDPLVPGDFADPDFGAERPPVDERTAMAWGTFAALNVEVEDDEEEFDLGKIVRRAQRIITWMKDIPLKEEKEQAQVRKK